MFWMVVRKMVTLLVNPSTRCYFQEQAREFLVSLKVLSKRWRNWQRHERRRKELHAGSKRKKVCQFFMINIWMIKLNYVSLQFLWFWILLCFYLHFENATLRYITVASMPPNLDPKAFSKMKEEKRPWHQLLTSAISLVWNLTQLIYSKPYICVEKKLRVKFKALLRRCIMCFFLNTSMLKKFAYSYSYRVNLFKNHDSWFWKPAGAKAFFLTLKGPGNEVALKEQYQVWSNEKLFFKDLSSLWKSHLALETSI